MLLKKRIVLQLKNSSKNDENEGKSGNKGTLANEVKLFKYFKQQFKDKQKLTHENQCTEKYDDNRTQQRKRHLKKINISILEENNVSDLNGKLMKINKEWSGKITDKQQVNQIHVSKINDKCKITENFLLYDDNYDVVINNKMNGIHYTKEEEKKEQQQKQHDEKQKKLIKQKSQNYFKQLKQSQYSIYWRACCFLSIFNTTIHRNLSKTTTGTTTTRTTKLISNKYGSSYRYKNFKILPKLGASSFVTLFILLCLELVLLSTVTNCAKTFYMHWNTSNSM